ncbi:MAG: metallophosphoesterase family protein, partial [Clostridia bacterium]|nr:metallophosphoesterase family protein [Clostridia bacterium]
LILSDCHANIDALHAVWEKEKDCDYILFLGDMVDFGFYPKETVRWFIERKEKLFAVRGNHDEWILEHKNDLHSANPTADFQALTFAALSDEEYDFLASLPHEATFTLEDMDFYMCHTPDELTNDVFYVEQQLGNVQTVSFFEERFATKFPDASSPKRMILYGHSHLQWVMSAGENRWMANPGSLSYRFFSYEPIRCADYIVWQDGDFGLRHVNFNTTHLYEQAQRFENHEATRLAKAFYRKKGESV